MFTTTIQDELKAHPKLLGALVTLTWLVTEGVVAVAANSASNPGP